MSKDGLTHRRAFELIRTTDALRRDGEQRPEVVRTARLLALCSLPRRESPEKEVVRDLRLGRDGREAAWVRVTYGSRKGPIAFGGDRVVLTAALHLALEADDPSVRFHSIRSLLKSLGLSVGGSQYARIRAAAERLKATYLVLGEARTREGLDQENRGAQTFLFEQWSLGEDRSPMSARGVEQQQLFGEIASAAATPHLRIGEAVWKELRSSRGRLIAPLALLRLYKANPLGWDYCWFLIHRCCAAKTTSRVPHEALVEMFADGCKKERDVISRLQAVHDEILLATDGRLKAKWVEDKPALSSGGRPAKRWALEIEPSESLLKPGELEGAG